MLPRGLRARQQSIWAVSSRGYRCRPLPSPIQAAELSPASASRPLDATPAMLLRPNRIRIPRFTASLPVRRSSMSTMEPRASPGTDALASLLESAGGRWTLSSDGRALERSFRFKTFAKTWDFMTAVSLQCKIRNHHPEWSNVYNTTFVRWTTHSSQSLSGKDIGMAAFCDAVAKDLGELEPEPPSSTIRGIADKATTLAGGCCAPKV